ncbi:MAG: barstar family protein [Firmicutes bacterium]|nr:barstar family protein [Bacillota bacterium]
MNIENMNGEVNTTKKIVIDGSLITTKEEFYEFMRLSLGSDLLIGSNLDALHDALTAVSYSAEFIVEGQNLLEHNLGSFWDKVCEVFNDSLDENYNISLSFES